MGTRQCDAGFFFDGGQHVVRDRALAHAQRLDRLKVLTYLI